MAGRASAEHVPGLRNSIRLVDAGNRSARRHLPVPLTSLIGREREVAAVKELLQRAEIRLLVLTGPGGVGKTRLALQVAHEIEPDGLAGICFVPLAEVRSPQDVLPAITWALGLRETPDQSLSETLSGFPGDLRFLLILDNFEQVIEAAPRMTDLLTRCPRLTILVTSRSVLDVYGEHVYPVPPLAVPLSGAATLGSPIGATTIADSTSVRLFVERARARQPDFSLTKENANAIAGICRHLDGLPLAIELAAARARVLPVNELATRLERRLPLLSRRVRDLPARFHTMRDAIGWSYDLLDPDEQALFRRLAVFAGGCTLDAAERVVGRESRDVSSSSGMPHDPRPMTHDSVLDLLASLVDKSLVRLMEDPGFESRFAMLETIREFALEQLEASGEGEGTGRRHAAYFLALAERAEPELTGAAQVAWLNRLEADLTNLRTAFDWLHQRTESDACLRFAKAIWRFGYTRGFIQQARAWLDLALAQSPSPSTIRTAALNGAGLLAATQGDLDRAEAFHREALDLCYRLDNRHDLAAALNGLGDVAAARGNHALAIGQYEAAQAEFREVGDRRGVAATFTNLGNLHWDMGNCDRAVTLHQQARILYHEIGDSRGVGWSVANLGRLAIEQGDAVAAVPHLRNALDLYRDLGDKSGIADTLEGSAVVAGTFGDPARAATLFGAADAIREEIGAPIPPNDRAQHEETLESLRHRLGAPFAGAWQAGRELSLEEAYTLAADPLLTGPRGMHSAPGSSDRLEGGARLGLTKREIEILSHLVEGKSDHEIAQALSISSRTVQTHLTNLYGKLGVKSRAAAAVVAVREQLIA